MPSIDSSQVLPFHIALTGPTASGKSAVAMGLATRLPCELVSVDSALVYRGMDIGTAKPSQQEMEAVPHHLINIRDPLQVYSAMEFVRDARARMQDIAQRGNLPLLVGGTMLYFKALYEGLDDLPAADPATRAALEQEAAQLGWPALHAQLAEVDPVTAQRLAPADSQRIQRALEVFRLTGQPMSALHAKRLHATPVQAGPGNSGARPARHVLISLEPSDRSWLHARIAQRFQTMLDRGLVEEVSGLRARGDLHVDLPSMRCVGYRQTWEALDGGWPRQTLFERGVIATRQLAKRQITWLRAMPQRTVVDAQLPDASARVLAHVKTALA